MGPLDMTALNKVRRIHEGCLHDCTGLTTLDLHPFMANLTHIGPNFMSGCSGLVSLDLAPFSNVQVLASNFLRNCTSLTSVDLAPLSHLKELSSGFLSGCSGLTSLDLSPLSRMSSPLPVVFLAGCTGLLSITPINNSHQRHGRRGVGEGDNVCGGEVDDDDDPKPFYQIPPTDEEDVAFRRRCLGQTTPHTTSSSVYNKVETLATTSPEEKEEILHRDPASYHCTTT